MTVRGLRIEEAAQNINFAPLKTDIVINMTTLSNKSKCHFTAYHQREHGCKFATQSIMRLTRINYVINFYQLLFSSHIYYQ